MRAITKKYNFIILPVLLITGVLVGGWALASHYDDRVKSADSQKEWKNGSQVVTEKPSALDQSNIILVLVSMGLIGFVGIRRQSKKLENLVKTKRPQIEASDVSLTEIKPEGQTCPDANDFRQDGHLNMPRSV